MSEQNQYTAADIARYHSGQMTAAERHALEKAALADPFLAEALDGYAYSAAPRTELAALQSRLQNRLAGEEQKRSLFFMDKPWLRVAALVLLIAGGAVLLLQSLPSSEQKIAITEAAEKEQTVSSSPSLIDSNSTTTAATAPPAEDYVSNETAKSSRAAPVTIQRQVAQESSAQSEALVPDDRQAATALTLTDSSNEIIAGRSAANATAAPVVQAREGDSLRNLNIVMQKADVDMKEVVVARKPAANAARRKFKVGADTLEPADGWEEFDSYVSANMKPPAAFGNSGAQREVELSFEIGRRGEPVNIVVSKSLCGACNEEAIRLLREGPRWKRNKKSGKVTIRFPD